MDLSYIPSTLPHREKHIKSIVAALRPIFKGYPGTFHPPLLFGPTGTGKTSSMKRAAGKTLKEVEGKIGLYYVHINCAVLGKTFPVAQKIAEKITSMPIRGFGESELLSRVFEELEARDEYLLLVLDDVDELIRRDRGRLLFIITRLEETSELEEKRIFSILIMRNREMLMLIQPAIRSKLMGPRIGFDPYRFKEMRSIVKQRVDLAFFKGSFSQDAIDQISFNGAKLGKGDARYSIALLQNSGYTTLNQKSSKVTVEHVRIAQQMFDEKVPTKIEKKVDKPGLVVLFSIAHHFKHNPDRYSMSLSDVRKILNSFSDDMDVYPISGSEFKKKIEELCEAGMIYRTRRGIVLPSISAESLYDKLISVTRK